MSSNTSVTLLRWCHVDISFGTAMVCILGTKTLLQTESLTNRAKCSTSFSDLDPKADLPIDCKNVLFHQRTWSMQDGER